MKTHTRTFETRGPVDPARNYVVPRTQEITDLKRRIEDGRYIVIFAPRQTGKTTFFRWTLNTLDETYLPIQLNFETCKNLSPDDFYTLFNRPSLSRGLERFCQFLQLSNNSFTVTF
jgi:AAA+ ATPase superfamily predicted ATPase